MAKKYRNFDIGIEFSIGGVVSEIRPVHMMWNGALCETALAREEVMRLIVPGKPRRPPQKPLFCTPPVRRKRECTGIEPAEPVLTPVPPILKTGPGTSPGHAPTRRITQTAASLDTPLATSRGFRVSL